MEEQDAITLLKIGDLNGLEPLVDAYYLKAVRTADLILGSKPAAEDIVQSAFLDAGNQIAQLKDGQFEPWFFKRLVSSAAQALKKQGSALPLKAQPTEITTAVLDWLSGGSLPADKLVEKDELREKVWQAAQQLDPKQRADLVCKYFVETQQDQANAQELLKHQLLSQLAEMRIPSVQDAWKAMQFKILAYDAARAKKPLKAKLGLLAIILLVGLLAAAFIYLLFTSGRALAENFFNQFFTGSSVEQTQLLAQPTDPIYPSPTHVPSDAPVSLPPTEVPPQPSEGEIYQSGSGGMTFSFGRDKNGTPVPFEMLPLAGLPEGWSRSNLLIESSTASMTQVFRHASDPTGMVFVLSQAQSNFPEAVGESGVIETLTFEETSLYLMDGGWLHFNSISETPDWTADEALDCFRWQAGGYTFTLTFQYREVRSPSSPIPDETLKILSLALKECQAMFDE